MSNFPIRRLRRLRKTEKIRDLVKEVSLSPKDLICPVFVEDGIQTKKQIESMPAIERLPLSDVVNEVDAIAELDIPAVMLFGIPQNRMMKVLLHLLIMVLFRKLLQKSGKILVTK